MSGVGVSGLLANLPGTVTPYPVLDFSLGLGGFRQVADVAARNAIQAPFRVVGMVAVTQNDGVQYELIGGTADANWVAQQPLPGVTTVDNGDNLSVVSGLWARAANAFRAVATIAARNLIPTAGIVTAGMLVYVTATQCLYLLNTDLTTWSFFAPSPAVALQAAWAIDGAAGSDNNSGAPGSPLATTDELSRRLSPNGTQCIASQNVTVTIAAGTYNSFDVAWGAAPGLSLTFTVSCAFTTVSDTLTSVVSTVANVSQGRITVAAGPLTAKMRIRSTSGASVGAVTYGIGALNSSTDSFVKAWVLDPPNSDVNIANGTTVGLDTLAVTINRFVFTPIYHAAVNPSFVLNDCSLPNGILIHTQGGSTGALVTGSSVGGRINGNIRFRNCSFLSGATFQGIGYLGVSPTLAGCVLHGSVFVSNCVLTFNTAVAVDAGALQLSTNSQLVGTTSDGCEWDNGSGLTAITLTPGCSVDWSAGGPMFGFGVVYLKGYSLAAGSWAAFSTAANVPIPSTTNITMAGETFAYADVPLALPDAHAAFTIASDTAAVATSGATVTLAAAARGNIGVTNVFPANPRKASYRFQAYLAITTVGGAGSAGGPLVQATWTDDAGVAQTVTVPFSAALNVTTLGGSGGELIIETNGASQVQYSVIGIATAGALQYSLRVNCRIESPG